jgi:hypothetical protein
MSKQVCLCFFNSYVRFVVALRPAGPSYRAETSLLPFHCLFDAALEFVPPFNMDTLASPASGKTGRRNSSLPTPLILLLLTILPQFTCAQDINDSTTTSRFMTSTTIPIIHTPALQPGSMTLITRQVRIYLPLQTSMYIHNRLDWTGRSPPYPSGWRNATLIKLLGSGLFQLSSNHSRAPRPLQLLHLLQAVAPSKMSIQYSKEMTALLTTISSYLLLSLSPRPASYGGCRSAESNGHNRRS